MVSFQTKDSGKKQVFETGYQRDSVDEKTPYHLIDFPMLKRWAELMGRGAVKYGDSNWKLAATEEELKRFKASALRHMIQWFEGNIDEDHAAAVFFNLAGAEMVKEKINGKGENN